MAKISSNTRWIVAAIVIVLSLYGVFSPYFITAEVVGKVTGKQGQAGQGNYIIFIKTPDGPMESLANFDTWKRFKFNSTDIQGGAEVGHTYKFKVLGYRNQMLSMYRNIITYEEVPQ
jgi:hypothetical protein